jgi:UDP-N-acetylglucosamine/UDP-N-acetyl-alpha-D-glucosaminouronate 4-epimerase
MTVCLITGGAGLIGSHLVDALVGRGCTVRVLDNFSTGAVANLNASRHHVELLFGDLEDLELVRQTAKGVELVFHFAAPTFGKFPLTGQPNAHERWESATKNVLLAARDAQVRRIIYASSCEVYGPNGTTATGEDAALRPLSPWGIASLAQENACMDFMRRFGVESVGLRFFNVFGPRQAPSSRYATVVPPILSAMRLGSSPTIVGDGLSPQDLLHVDDAVHACLLASETPRVGGKVYNIARGVPTHALELIETVNSILGTAITPTHAAAPINPELCRIADIMRAEVDLGFCPAMSLERSLRQFLHALAAKPVEKSEAPVERVKSPERSAEAQTNGKALA